MDTYSSVDAHIGSRLGVGERRAMNICVHHIPTAIGAYLAVGALEDKQTMEDVIQTLPPAIFMLGIRAMKEHPEWAAYVLQAEGQACSECEGHSHKNRPMISSELLKALVESFPVNAVLEVLNE